MEKIKKGLDLLEAFENTDEARVVDVDFVWRQGRKRHRTGEVDLMVEAALLSVWSMALLLLRLERQAEILDRQKATY